MAGALISTVFNHLWPRARSSVTITQMKQLPLYEKEELVKTRYEEKTKYIEHFANFFNEHYFDENRNKDFYKEYLEEVRQNEIPTWDVTIRNSFKDKITPDEEKLLTRLVAVIDFISGLTDRYCLEMFNEVYQEFMIT
jgi:dGTP triphosphohydrolase